MQNKFSRDFVEQKDKEAEQCKKEKAEWRLKVMNSAAPQPPPHRVAPEDAKIYIDAWLLAAVCLCALAAAVCFAIPKIIH